jgi:Flp pilus assembly protein TadB
MQPNQSKGAIVNQTTGTTEPSVVPERSTGDLVKQMSEQVSTLVRDELKLAQLEMTRKGKQAGIGVGMFGGSGIIALYGLACLIACAVIGISRVLAPWLSALVVGVALLAVAGIAALVGKSRLQKATPPVPQEAVRSVKTDVDEIKERTRR